MWLWKDLGVFGRRTWSVLHLAQHHSFFFNAAWLEKDESCISACFHMLWIQELWCSSLGQSFVANHVFTLRWKQSVLQPLQLLRAVYLVHWNDDDVRRYAWDVISILAYLIQKLVSLSIFSSQNKEQMFHIQHLPTEQNQRKHWAHGGMALSIFTSLLAFVNVINWLEGQLNTDDDVGVSFQAESIWWCRC